MIRAISECQKGCIKSNYKKNFEFLLKAVASVHSAESHSSKAINFLLWLILGSLVSEK
jgi:hypothetical protein